MKIVDDGRGFSLAEIERRARHEGGFGLLGMRDRAALVGGRVQIISSANKRNQGRGFTAAERDRRGAVTSRHLVDDRLHWEILRRSHKGFCETRRSVNQGTRFGVS